MTFLGFPGNLPRSGGMGEAGLTERRWTVQLYRAWDTARSGTALPCMTDFDLGVIEALGADCFLLELEGGAEAPRFRYFGRALAAQIGRDLTGQAISSLSQPSLLAEIAEQYSQAVARRRPIGLEGLFTLDVDEHLAYRGVLLPFAKDGSQVDAVLGCVRSRRSRGGGKAATPLQLMPSSVPVSCDGGAVDGSLPSEKLRKMLAHARQGVVLAPIEEPRRQSWAKELAGVARRSLRRRLWPERMLGCARTAPAIGRSVLGQPTDGEFAVLIARRLDGQSHRYEVIAVADSVVANLALRWVALRSRRRSGTVPGSGTIAAERLRASRGAQECES